MRPAIRNGYYRVTLRINNKAVYMRVHQLVVGTFVGTYQKDLCVNHKDGNKLNNDLSNLELVSFSENTAHSYRIGTSTPMDSTACHFTRLTVDDVQNVRRLLGLGIRQKEICTLLGMNKANVSRIATGKTWRRRASRD